MDTVAYLLQLLGAVVVLVVAMYWALRLGSKFKAHRQQRHWRRLYETPYERGQRETAEHMARRRVVLRPARVKLKNLHSQEEEAIHRARRLLS